MQLSIELLPAPFGPMMARISCSRTSKLMSLSALTPPKRRLMLRTSRITSPIGRALMAAMPSRRASHSSADAAGLSCGLPNHGECRHVDDLQGGSHPAAAAVLELDLDVDELLGLAAVQRLHQHLIPLGNEAAADLARAGQLAVVGVELLVQDEEAADLAAGELFVGGEVGVDLGDAIADQLAHLGLLRKLGVAAIRQVALLGPVADSFEVDVDEGANLFALVAEGHGFLDEGAELELVLDVFRREQGAVAGAAEEPPDVLRAVDDLDVPGRVDEAGVTRVIPTVEREDLRGGLRILVVLLQQPGRANHDLAVVENSYLHAFDGHTHRVAARFMVGLQAHEHGGFSRAVELLEVDAD